MKRYNSQSWIDPRIEVRPSSTEGMGLFARESIRAGEIVIVWGGQLLNKEDIDSGKARAGSVTAISENLYLAGLASKKADPDNFMNHSCDPNIWMKDEVTLSARRDIFAGEELTADYAMWEVDENWTLPHECGCGSSLCRKVITGQDWKLAKLQEDYKDHFSPFINKRIKEAR